MIKMPVATREVQEFHALTKKIAVGEEQRLGGFKWCSW